MCRAAHLAAGHDAEQVDGNHPFEVAHVIVEEPAEAPRHPRDVAHDLQPAEALDGERDELLDLGGVGHVGLLEGGTCTEVDRHRLAPVGIDVRDDDVCAFGDEAFGGDPADPVGAAGDDGHLACELTGHGQAAVNSMCRRWRPRRMNVG